MEKSFLETLIEGKLVDFNSFDDSGEVQFLKPGKAKGISFGGYLSCVQSLIGTQYMPHVENNIFFWEVVDEPHIVDMQLNSFKRAGVLDKISGMVIGYIGACEETEYPDNYHKINDMVLYHTKEFDFPIVSVPLFGHFIENVTFPLGANFEINSEQKIIRQVSE